MMVSFASWKPFLPVAVRSSSTSVSTVAGERVYSRVDNRITSKSMVALKQLVASKACPKLEAVSLNRPSSRME